MTDEYIRKADAVEAVRQAVNRGYGTDYGVIDSDVVYEILDEVEPADVVPVVHGHWMPQEENYEFKEVWMKCSACGYPVSRWTGNTNFCPNCGAKMDEEE